MATMQEPSYFETIDGVNNTWDEIKMIPDYETVAGVLLFKKIFELAPAAVKMFSFGKESSTDDSEAIYSNPRFLRHARNVVKMLDSALSMLGPDLEPLQKVLRKLGGRHVEYGVLPAHYPIVGEALLATLEAALGAKWNDEIKSGWAGIYGIVSSSMLEGAQQRIEQLKRLREIKERKEAEEKKELQRQASVQAYSKPPRPAPAVGSSDVDYVQESWETIKKIPNYADVAGSILFKRIFELAPGAMNMFGFASGFDANSEEIYKHPQFLRHARGVVKMLDTAVALLGNVEPLLKALGDLGARHVEYGVLPAHYPIVGDALLYTLEAALGDKWNDQVKAGWARIYGSVSTGMLKGAHRRIEEEKRVREAEEKEKAKEEQRKVTVMAYHKEVVPLPPGVAPPEVNHVKVTWDEIKEIPNHVDVAGGILFRKIFELAPGAMKIFSFAKDFETDSEEFYNNPLFLQHARGVVGMLDTAVNMLGPDMNPLKKALQELGARHIEYGVVPAHYPIIGQALLYTLQTALGAKWTPEVEQGWTGIFGVVSSSMLEGAQRQIGMEDSARAEREREAQRKEARRRRSDARRGSDSLGKSSNHSQSTKFSTDSAYHKKAEDVRGHVRKLRLARRRASQGGMVSPLDAGDVNKIIGEALSISSKTYSRSSSGDSSIVSDISDFDMSTNRLDIDPQ